VVSSSESSPLVGLLLLESLFRLPTLSQDPGQTANRIERLCGERPLCGKGVGPGPYEFAIHAPLDGVDQVWPQLRRIRKNL